MKFGLFGGARTDPGEQASDSRIYTDYIDYICEAEQLGFHSIFLVEHHFTGFGQVSATINFLTYLAAKTSTLRLGTAVLVLPWHNPALLAEQAATLDLLSNGRFDFGIGKGYRWGEFHGFCIPMQEAEERYQETVAFLRKAWTSQGRFSHHGKYWHYAMSSSSPRRCKSRTRRSGSAPPARPRSVLPRRRATTCCSVRAAGRKPLPRAYRSTAARSRSRGECSIRQPSVLPARCTSR
jgi:alkanesulfonate monooxygenase SsuD/methylene tetrahydromethanopterin reductase-like flavin-dependent oxidoreductase (luciferase family)